MKKNRSKSCLLAALAAAAILPASAEDIDLYAGVDGGAVAPNVLFYLDNTSNWSANNQAWKKSDVLAKCSALADPTKAAVCSGYVDQVFGANSSLVQGAVEARALKLVLNELVCGADKKLSVNVGIMMFSPSNVGAADGSSVTSTYIRHRVAPMTAARCATMLADLEWMASNPTDSSLKTSSSAGYGNGMYEAFKYFGGWTSPGGYASGTPGTPVGRTGYGPERYGDPTPADDPDAFTDGSRMTYRSPLTGDASCGNNYMVLVGNTWPNSDYGTNANASPYPSNTLMSRLGHDPGPQIYPKPLLNRDKSDVRFGDEWAKFLYTTDVSDAPGAQNVRLFTIDVFNKAQDLKQSALLKSMADQSGVGGYFTVGGDLYALVSAFTNILTQIASVNSVFASASLPVSVNTQGTFLNQVFMGVFRPDANAQQRWQGNLKQYRFGLDGGTMYLADSLGAVAVDAVNTGFIQNCAVSYWTSDSGTYWESITGMNLPSACETSALSPWSDRPDGPMVERGGAAQRLRALGHAARNIRTCSNATCASIVDFTSGSGGAFGLSEDLVKWVRGENRGDGVYNAGTGASDYTAYGLAASATRPTVHGEVVHSRPLAVNYGVNGVDDVVVFYGAGDGMLRAINGNQGAADGNELWAFVAPEHWSGLTRLRSNSPLVSFPNVDPDLTPAPKPKTYFFDGSIGGYQERSASSVDKVYVFPTMRRGGRAVYAFDVSKKPGTGANQPTLMWRYSDANEPRMGQSWSTPTAFRVKGITEPLVVFGAGYDSCEDSEDPAAACAGVTRGRGVVVRDAAASSPSHLRFFDPGADGGRFAADVAAVDVNRDGFVDALYAVDTRGNVWRINTSNPADGYRAYPGGVADWPMVKIAEVSQWGGDLSERRKFMYAPSTVVLGNQVTVLVGTGDREKPTSSSNAAKVLNRFYGIRDNVAVTSGVVAARGYGSSAGGIDLADLKNVTDMDPIDPTTIASFKGWFRDLSTTVEPYEQVVTAPLTLAGVTYFSTFQAKSAASSCLNLGTARAYQIDFQTGARLPDKPLVTTFVSQGIPPSPVGGVVLVDGKLVPFVIGGPGPTPLSPTKVVPKVRPDRKPVFRYQRIDKS
ncbi:PilC/PilY family type IV pilus protein [Burkholderiaceae bacterium FT117]|uniref:pilus assembly protein n=1 Tax=Zeimonas sediminis TaxID=2944268 RepID=UPI002342E0F8|nr:PilC/PilY family type IV pilus protein [Zeimonas sediminis]MCM5570622.1 PilC/PilY family type IV pilus protein [Zeimonas sediminis]